MPLARKRKTVRQQVADRANHRCEYCQISSAVSTSAFEIEHIEPMAQDGDDDLSNMAWSCRRCNSNKGISTTGTDPEDGSTVSLYNPRRASWSDHFDWNPEDNTRITGKTSVGRATIAFLDLNRPELILLRRLMRYENLHPPVTTEPPNTAD
ncbi:MAG: hypothetical protein OHK0029_41060 [Armatimonadaceae bacterium]